MNITLTPEQVELLQNTLVREYSNCDGNRKLPNNKPGSRTHDYLTKRCDTINGILLQLERRAA